MLNQQYSSGDFHIIPRPICSMAPLQYQHNVLYSQKAAELPKIEENASESAEIRNRQMDTLLSYSTLRQTTPYREPQEDSKVSITLVNQELWEKFHKHTNEMVVTKPGRKMFPKIELSIQGLETNGDYAVALEMDQIDRYRYKFQAGGWSPAGQDDIIESSKRVNHQNIANNKKGSNWMSKTISFDKVKLTNKPNSDDGTHISLLSMHKYRPRISIFKLDETSVRVVRTFMPEVMQFIAVTAYQSENIIRLKVQYNPFAKGFREGSVRKRSLSISPDSRSSPTRANDCLLAKRPLLTRKDHATTSSDHQSNFNPLSQYYSSFCPMNTFTHVATTMPHNAAIDSNMSIINGQSALAAAAMMQLYSGASLPSLPQSLPGFSQATSCPQSYLDLFCKRVFNS